MSYVQIIYTCVHYSLITVISYKSTREYITIYFEKAHSALSSQTTTDSDVLIQLKLLYCQLYEVSYIYVSNNHQQFTVNL